MGIELREAVKGGNFGDVLNVAFAVGTYRDSRKQGDSFTVSAAKTASSFAWGEFYYGGLSSVIERSWLGKAMAKIPSAFIRVPTQFGVMAIISSAPSVAKLGAAVYEHTGQEMSRAYGSRGKLGSGHFNMTEAGYTMRQRSLNAIRQNGLNTQAVLGNEARTYFRGSM